MDEKYEISEEQLQAIYRGELEEWKRSLNIFRVRAKVYEIVENENGQTQMEKNIEECVKAIEYLESKLE